MLQPIFIPSSMPDNRAIKAMGKDAMSRVQEDISIVAGLKVRGNPKYFYWSWLMSTFSCLLLLPLLFLLF